MERIVSMCAEAAVAATVLVPVFFLLYRQRWHQRVKTCEYLLFALYLCGVYAAAGLPDVFSLTFRPRLNVTFFAYMFSDYKSSLLNVLFFVPLGFLLPMIWTRFRPVYKTVLFGFAASVFIELMQLFSPRATDVNDLLTNTAGALVGCCAARLLQLLFPGLTPENDSRGVYLVCIGVVALMFLVHPMLLRIFS